MNLLSARSDLYLRQYICAIIYTIMSKIFINFSCIDIAEILTGQEISTI